MTAVFRDGVDPSPMTHSAGPNGRFDDEKRHAVVGLTRGAARYICIEQARSGSLASMANRVCWNCGVKAHQEAHGEAAMAKNSPRYFLAFKCDECGVMSIGERSFEKAVSSAKSLLMARDAPVIWHPAQALGKDFPDVPAHIAAAASEAHTCHSVNAYRSAILMARAVVEASAKEKGIVQGNLASKIDGLLAKGLVREMVKDTAHEIRFLGNDMAHGDFVSDVSAVESEDVLAFMDEVLEEVFQAPARLDARRTERLARKAAAEAGS